MMSGAYLYILAGESYQFQANVTLGNNAVDLGASYLWIVAQQEPIDGMQNNVIFNINSDTGEISLSENNSRVTVNMNADLTANLLQSNAARWELRCRTANNQVYSLDRGSLAVEFPIG